MNTAICKKENHVIVVAYIFRGLIHFHHGVTWFSSGRFGARVENEIPAS